MADDNTPPLDGAPTGSPERPGDGRLRPRSLAWAAVSAVVAVLTVALVLVAHSGDERPIRTVAADRPDIPTTSATEESTTSTQPPPTTTTTQATSATAPPTTSAPPTTTPVPPCQESDITVTVDTDKPTYTTGEVVAVVVRATNTSGHDCPPGGLANVRIVAGDGTVVYDMPGGMASWPQGARHPTGATWHDDYHRWDQRCHGGSCDGVQQPPGDYTIEATWRRYGSARNTVRIG